MEHEFGGRVRVVKGERRVGGEGEGVGVEGEDVNAVGVFFNEAAEGQAVGVGRGERHAVDWVGGFVAHGVFGSEVGFLGRILHFCSFWMEKMITGSVVACQNSRGYIYIYIYYNIECPYYP